MTKIKAPGKCTEKEQNMFIELVRKGEEVNPTTLPSLVKSAHLLAFSYNDANTLVGVGAIKRPNLSYRNDVFNIAKSSLKHDQFEFELGWIYTEEEFRRRGIGKMIVRGLLGNVKDRKIYATTRTDNNAMKHILKKYKFYKSGEEYKSTRGKHSLVLFVKD